MNPAKFLAVLVLILSLVGCSTNNVTGDIIESLPITLHTLNCSDTILGEMVTRCVQEYVLENARSKVVLSNELQTGIIISGSIYFKDISAGSGSSLGIVTGSSAGAFGGGSSQSNSFSGAIVEGVTLIASRDGEELGSATYFQRIEKGEYLSPQDVAEEAAEKLLGKLAEMKLIVSR